MNLKNNYVEMPFHHKEQIKMAMASEAVRILFYDARLECMSALACIDTSLAVGEFKQRYLELQKSAQAYDEILYLINHIKQEIHNENNESN